MLRDYGKITINFWFWAFVFSFLSSQLPLAASSEGCPGSLEKLADWMQPGIYRGLSPTDEGPLRMGELEMKVTDTEMIFRMATGLEIQAHRLPLSELVPMTSKELTDEFIEGSTAMAAVVGFKHVRNPAPRFIIPRKPTWTAPRITVRMGEMPDILGPTMLFTPSQRRFGLALMYFSSFEQLYRSACKPGHVVIPRLKYNGTTDKSKRPCDEIRKIKIND